MSTNSAGGSSFVLDSSLSINVTFDLVRAKNNHILFIYDLNSGLTKSIDVNITSIPILFPPIKLMNIGSAMSNNS